MLERGSIDLRVAALQAQLSMHDLEELESATEPLFRRSFPSFPRLWFTVAIASAPTRGQNTELFFLSFACG